MSKGNRAKSCTRRVIGLAVLSALLPAYAARGGSGSISASACDWIGYNSNFFETGNWYFGAFASPQTTPTLPIYYGEVETFVNGVFTGFVTPVGPMTLSQNWSTPTVYLSDSVPAVFTINSGATYTVNNLYVGEHFTHQNEFTRTAAYAELRLSNAMVVGNVVVGSDGSGRLTTSGTAAVTSLTLGRDTVSTGTLSVSSGSAFTVSTGTTFGSGTSAVSNAGTLDLGPVSGTLGTLTNSGTLGYTGNLTVAQLTNSGTLNFAGSSRMSGTVTNSGDLKVLGSAAAGATLSVNTDTTLTGGGTVTLTDETYSTFYAPGTSGVTFTNADNTLRGTGEIAAYGTFINQGTINASLPGKALTLSSPGTAITNTGTLTASNGGTLRIKGTINNANGTINGPAGSTVSLAGGTVVGGTLSGTVTVTAGGTGRIAGAIHNTGDLNIVGNNQIGSATLAANAGTTLAGGGTITLVDADYSTFYATDGNAVTVTNADNTIRGTGSLYSYGNFINKGTVSASVAGKPLNLQTVGSSALITNTGILTASNGGILRINAMTNNAGGTITGPTGSTVNIAGGTIVGGTLGGTLGGTVSIIGGNGRIAGAINNTGDLNIAGNNQIGSATLATNTDATLAGGGTVTLTDTDYSVFYTTDGSTVTFTNADNTIRGTGGIYSYGNFINKGTVSASVANKPLNLQTVGSEATITNTGILTATNGGILRIKGTINNAGGTVIGPAGSTVNIAGGTIVGGTLGGTVTMAGGTGKIAGIVNNTGDLNIDGNNQLGSATLAIDTDTTLTGGGKVTLADRDYSAFYAPAVSGVTFTNANNTIRGAGSILSYGQFVNNGTVNASVAGKSLTLQTVGSGALLTNTGTLTTSNGGTLVIMSALDNTGVIAANGSTVTFTSVAVGDGLTGSGTLLGNATVYGSGALRGADLATLGSKVSLNRASSTEPAATVRALLVAGFANGFTAGQLRSSGATATTGLGYRDDGAYVTVMDTYYGDLDLDGGVSINDFNVMAANFGKSADQIWAGGDFDYDGGVSINDFNLLAANFGRSIAAPGAGPNAAALALWDFAVAHDDVAGFIAATGVPEPATLGLALAGGMLTLRRRIRRSRVAGSRSR